VGALIMVNF